MIPFSGHFTADLPAINNVHRLMQIREFMGWRTTSELFLRKQKDVMVLDIGKPNYISRELCVDANTSGDLNKRVGVNSSSFDIITNFEVINHVMNPLFLIKECYKLLRGGGIMYLSTPRPFPRWLSFYHGSGNFVEYRPEKLRTLFEYVGFKIKREKVYRPYPFYYIFYGFLQPIRWFFPFRGDTIHHAGSPTAKWIYFGFRPLFKWFFHKYIIFELEKG